MNAEDIKLRGLYYFPAVHYEQVQVVGALLDPNTDKVHFKLRNDSGDEFWTMAENLLEQNPLEYIQDQSAPADQEAASEEEASTDQGQSAPEEESNPDEESKPIEDVPYSNKVCVHPGSDKPADANLIASGDIVTRRVMAKLLGISTTSLSYIEGVPCAGACANHALMYDPDKVIPYVKKVNTELAAKIREYGLLDNLEWKELWSLANYLNPNNKITLRMAAWLLDYEVGTAYRKAEAEWKTFISEDAKGTPLVHLDSLLTWLMTRNRARYIRILKTFPNLDSGVTKSV